MGKTVINMQIFPFFRHSCYEAQSSCGLLLYQTFITDEQINILD